MESARILPLSQEVIGQIAAGEVVERPSAAIKELVENSMDAGATAITVEIREGGISYFKVTDNGKGIEPSDIRMAFERHATSKIRTARDLYDVATLGFRGEALASIAAVAHVTCMTRTKDHDSGISVQNDGGYIADIRDAACPMGTTMIVKDLFFNAPVRKKFLKKPSSEAGFVTDVMARLILSHPEISFRYVSDGKSVYFSPGDGKLESAVMSIYGVQTLKMMTRVSGHMNGLMLDGFIGIGELGRGNRSYEQFFLNGRAMKSALLTSALETACHQRVMIGKFPMCVLHLTIPFDQVDVNVHPNKWEVRFQNEHGIMEAVQTIISDVLLGNQKTDLIKPQLFDADKEDKKPVIPVVKTEIVTPTEKTIPAPVEPIQKPIPTPVPITVTRSVPIDVQPVIKQEKTLSTPDIISSATPVIKKPAVFKEPVATLEIPVKVEKPIQQVSPQPEQILSETVAKAFDDQPPLVLGSIFNTYIVMEYHNEMLLCDQHAAHERLLYEQLVRETSMGPASQTLLIPQIIPLSHTQYVTFEENTLSLENAGFDVEPFGDDAVQLRGVPIVLGQPESKACLTDVLDSLSFDRTMPENEKTQKIMQMACKHAVKGGEELPLDALRELVHRILKEDIPPTCPHGRPIMISLSRTDLEKRFKRIQN